MYSVLYTTMSAARTRNQCFTLNNYTEDDIKSFDLGDWKDSAKYLIYGYEVGEETETPHLQGYVEWTTPWSLDRLKKLNPRISWHTRRGTAQQAADYCKKEGNFVEVGTISKAGKRTDLEAVAREVLAGKPIDAIAAQYAETFIKYHKGIRALQATLFKDRTERPYVEWRYGLAGVGKTRMPIDKHNASHYIKDGTIWWDNYAQQDAIIIDDFDGKWPFRDFLRLLDRYKYQGQYKGGYVPINSPFIYITCEHAPQFFWPMGNDLSQVIRRIDKIEHVIDRNPQEANIQVGTEVPNPS